MPEYASEESRENKIIIAVAVVLFLVVVTKSVAWVLPEAPPSPVTIFYKGEQLFPRP